MSDIEFQDVILTLSEAMHNNEGLLLSEEEVSVMMLGFAQMAETINNAAVAVETAEAELETERQRKRLWKPGN